MPYDLAILNITYPCNMETTIQYGIKVHAPGKLSLIGGVIDRGRLPTLPLSQYHRRGEV